MDRRKERPRTAAEEMGVKGVGVGGPPREPAPVRAGPIPPLRAAAPPGAGMACTLLPVAICACVWLPGTVAKRITPLTAAVKENTRGREELAEFADSRG